jgi:hypothetical protein
MLFIILFALTFTSIASFKTLPPVTNKLPDYVTPNWVYKDIYNHNKKYNKITKKIKNNNISINDEYQLIKYYKLPFGILQPINYY